MSIKLNCFDCKHRFNLTTREPIYMICCGNTACRLFVTTKMIKTPQNAQRGIAQKGDFQCSGCQCKYYSNCDTEQPLMIQPNNIFKSIIAQTQDNFQIFCKDHPDVFALKYCSNHRALLCKDCTYEKHTDHLNTCRQVNQESIQQFFQ